MAEVNNSLMKKTKAQLVEIILRKDDIERGLRADIKGTEKEFDKIKSKYKVLESKYCLNQTKYANLQMDYEEQCDEHILCKQELINKITNEYTCNNVKLAELMHDISNNQNYKNL